MNLLFPLKNMIRYRNLLDIVFFAVAGNRIVQMKAQMESNYEKKIEKKTK